MASVHKHNKSPYWYCAYTLPNGKRVFRSTKERDRKKAQDVCRTLERTSQKARAGELSQTRARKLFNDLLENAGQEPLSTETLDSFAKSYLSGKELSLKPGVFKLYRRVIAQFLGHLGDKALTDVTATDVARFRDLRLKTQGVSAATFLLDLKVLRNLFGLARRQGLISHNPAETVQLPPVRHIERKVFTSEEIGALLFCAPSQEWQTLILTGYYLGARLTDAASLRWSDVDLDKGLIHYTQAKTNKEVLVPIHAQLEAQLLAIAGSDNPGHHLCPSLSKTPIQGRAGLSSQFIKLMKMAGIDRCQVQAAKRRFSRKSFHALRHSFASALANVGVSSDVRMKLTGHKSVDVHRQYTHLEIEVLRTAIAALPSLRAPS
jgi:integrase